MFASCAQHLEGEALRVVFWAGVEEQKIEQANVDAYMQAHPGLQVSLESIPDSYLEKLATAFASGKPPDVLLLDSVLIPRFLEGDVLLDLQPYLARRAEPPALPFDEVQFIPEVFAIASRENAGARQVYALPKDFTPLVVYYNKRLFAQDGVAEPHPEWGWEDFRATARALTRDKDSDGRTDQYGTLIYTTPIFNMPFFWQAGGDALSPDGQMAAGYLDSPASISAAEFFTGLVADGFAPDPTAREALGGSAFMSGKVAMTISGHWSMPGFRQAAADAAAGKADANTITLDDIGVAPLPAGKQRANVIYESGWAVAKDSRHREAAVELAAFLSGEECQRRRAQMGLAVSANRAVAAEMAAGDPREQVFLDEVPVARAPWGTRIADWSVVESLIMEATERIILRDADAQTAMHDAAKLVDDELNLY